MDFKVDHDPSDGPAVIICPKRVDVNNSGELKDILNDLVGRDCYQIILDLQHTRYMDSSGLGAIVSRIADLRANAGDVRVAGARDHVAGLFRLTHLDKIIQLFSSVNEARRSFME